MRKLNARLPLVFVFLFVALTVSAQSPEQSRWDEHVRNVTITRDSWGIAHISGNTDADAVFGMIYAQAEDDFNRVETNYLNSLGRLAEAEGESAVWSDLRQRLFIDPEELKADYAASPDWLKKLMDAWADGLNFYLAKHSNVKPRVITKFEPWMALSFTEGSIGGDIENVDLRQLKAFYENGSMASAVPFQKDPLAEPTGSNGMAIAPSNTQQKKALLLINPHTSFYFRSELQVTSKEGLNAYGASTWGQFFIYQGFNEHLGWMHTSSAVDSIDEFLETVSKKDGKYVYKHGSEEKPVIEKPIKLFVKTADGTTERVFMTYRTHHGPVIASVDGKWMSIGLMNTPVQALMQSFGRTKAKNYDEFKKVMALQANSSNATLYADADGNISYFHPNFVPRRDPKFDWTKPVDGSDPASDWKGLLSFNELPNIKNPATGWVYNSNDWPWAAAGKSSLKQADFPKYVDRGVESARGRHAVLMLQEKKDFTLESLNTAAYDSYLPWFETTLPRLLKAWDELPAGDEQKTKLAEQIAKLRAWNMRWSVDSVPTSLAVFWAEDISRRSFAEARNSELTVEKYVAEKAAPKALLQSLEAASDRLTADFGSWETPWGNINRFQRISPEIVHPFDDAGPSIPVGFTSGNWGSLASFGARPIRGTKKWYGTSGNSFVAVVEFGPRVRAKAVTAGGESGNPKSPHFDDQATRYSTGSLREVYFYPDQLKGNTSRVYHPGE